MYAYRPGAQLALELPGEELQRKFVREEMHGIRRVFGGFETWSYRPHVEIRHWKWVQQPCLEQLKTIPRAG